jgi:hypothetical protein
MKRKQQIKNSALVKSAIREGLAVKERAMRRELDGWVHQVKVKIAAVDELVRNVKRLVGDECVIFPPVRRPAHPETRYYARPTEPVPLVNFNDRPNIDLRLTLSTETLPIIQLSVAQQDRMRQQWHFEVDFGNNRVGYCLNPQELHYERYAGMTAENIARQLARQIVQEMAK